MKKYMLVMVLLGILLFGCTTPSAPAETPDETQAATQPSGEQPAAETIEGDQSAEQPAAEQPTTDESLAGMTLSEIYALGTPIECDIKVKDVEGVETIKMYIKGNNFREEMTVGGVQMVTILKDEVLYTKMAQKEQMVGTPFEGCDWLKMEAKGTQQAPSGQGGVDVESLEQENKIEMDCKPAIFGDEKFTTPGNVCSMSEIIGGIPGGMPSGEE